MALKRETQVLIVGAGPVGLFTALCLSERGIDVQVIDKEWRGSVHSYALALHPRSLRLLDEHGAADGLIKQGHRIERIAFYDGDRRAVAIDIGALGGPFPFLLVVPQSAVENALEQQLSQRKVKVFWNHQAQRIEDTAAAVTTRVARLEKYSMGYPVARTEWMVTKETDVRSSFLVGADGYHSFVRKHLGVRYEDQGEPHAFCVFEFPSRIDFQHEARVVFHDGTTNVVWPLDERRGRWSFQVDRNDLPELEIGTLHELIRARAPWFQGRIEETTWTTTVLFERRLVDRFGRDHVWLAGDAAHITGPVGAQSMNVGLREGRDLAERFSSILKTGGRPDLLAGYEAERQAEWRRLLGLEGRLEQTAPAAAWLSGRAAGFTSCVPASGEDLDHLLAQLGLRLLSV